MKSFIRTEKISNIFSQLNEFEKHIHFLEDKILGLEKKIYEEIHLQRSTLIRLKNQEHLTDEFIAKGSKYLDLNPRKAFEFYSSPDFNFVLIDVSAKDYVPKTKIPEALHIPWEDFSVRFFEIKSKTIPLLIISEDGTKSILACKFLSKLGYYNCNNISGGYLYWPEEGLRTEERSSKK